METSKKTLSTSGRPGHPPGRNGPHFSVQLLEKARADTDAVLKGLGSQLSGLSEAEADSRLKQVRTNEIAREKRQSGLMRLLSNIKNPLVLLLLALGVLSYLTGDLRAMVVIFVMVVLGVVLRFFQEMRADNAAEKLKAMVSNTATLVRDGEEKEVSLKMLVPGDIIRLAAGDMAPADVRVLSAKDLFLNQAALTGEALPVEKKAAPAPADVQNPLDLPNICFLGSNVESGSATAVVIHTGNQTYFGSLAVSIVRQRQLTSFDKGVNKFTWMMIWFIAVMVPAVFLFIGPISSIFDYATFFLMLYVFNCWHNPALFHTGWFVESLFTQTLIIHVIRTNKIPFIESRASRPLILTSILIVAVGAWLTISPLAKTLGFVPLPALYWLFLAIMLLSYAILTQVVKTWFIRKFGE